VDDVFDPDRNRAEGGLGHDLGTDSSPGLVFVALDGLAFGSAHCRTTE
jgi:hypothetical protein